MTDVVAGIGIRAGTARPELAATREANEFVASLPPGVSAQMLLGILEQRLQTQDSVIRGYTDTITANTNRADEVLGIMQELLVLQSEGNATLTGTDAETGTSTGNMFASEYGATAGSGTPAEVDERFRLYIDDLKERAAAAGITVTAQLRGGADGVRVWLDLSTVSGNIEQAKQKLSEINSGNEIEMVRLQDVMQQRSSGVQLFTNLLKQLSDSQMAVIRNISG